MTYTEHAQLDRIRSGDLLVWNESSKWTTGQKSWLDRFILLVIRFFTMSEYGHVGIAYRDGDQLLVLEATIPQVRVFPVSESGTFYCIPMDIDWKPEYRKLIYSKVGIKYSVLDAIRGYLGWRVDGNDRYQCVELADELYRQMGVALPLERHTPSYIVKAALEYSGSGIYIVKPRISGEFL